MKWQSYGDTIPEAARKVFAKRGAHPTLEAEIEDVIAAASPHSMVYLGFLYIEGQFGVDTSVNPISNRNLPNHRSVANTDWHFGGKPNGDWMKYPSHAAAAAAWKQRLLNPIYKDNVYGPARDGTVLDVAEIYAPRSDGNDPEHYAEVVEIIAGELRAAVGGTPVDPKPTPGMTVWEMIFTDGKVPRHSDNFDVYVPENAKIYDYSYCWRPHGKRGRHIGTDVFMDLYTPLRTPVRAKVMCVGTDKGLSYCGAFNDYLGRGAGNIAVEFLVPIRGHSGVRLLLGHSSHAPDGLKPGQIIEAGTVVAYSGGMYSAHGHFEVWVPSDECQCGYCAQDPPEFLDVPLPEVSQPKPTPKPEPIPGVTYWTEIPGLPGGPLGTSYPVEINLIAVDGSQRTGAKARKPRKPIEHGTANGSNPSARAEIQYFVNGAEGRGVSVHCCGDHERIVVGLPMDEIGVHAGSADGNARGFACEMIEATATWNDPARRDATIYNCADFMARVDARLDGQGVGDSESDPDYHFNYGNGACPAKLQNVTIGGEKAIAVYERIFDESYADEKRRMKGAVPTVPNPEPGPMPKPQPPKPTPVPVPIPEPMKRLLANAEAVGLTLAILRERFGTEVSGYAFDVYGQVSLAWLGDALADGEFPALESVNEVSPTNRWFWFQDGTGYRWDGKAIHRLRSITPPTLASESKGTAAVVEQDERPATTRNKRKAAKWTIL